MLVTQTLEEARKVDPARKCFRMIGGTLAERTVDEVLPALNTNLTGVSVALCVNLSILTLPTDQTSPVSTHTGLQN